MIGTTSNGNNRFDTEVLTFKYFWDSSIRHWFTVK